MTRITAMALLLALGGCSWFHDWFHPASASEERAKYVACLRQTTAGPSACEQYRNAYNIRAAKEGLPALPPPGFGMPQ